MRTNAFDLTGRVGLVTGANSGLGLGFARGIVNAGGDVVIWGRRADKNEEAAEMLRSYGGRVFTQAVDVADEAQVRAAMEAAVAEMGRIDCVVANAGISSRGPAFHEMPAEMYHELLAINQHGAVYTLQAALSHMVQRAEAGDPGGSLIICGSLSVFKGIPRLEHYAAAKGALASVMRGIAAEYGRYGVRAIMIAPGWFESGLQGRPQEVLDRMEETMRTRNPIPRAGYPADLEGVIVYLMSDASAYHTGDLMVIDGGASIVL
jgi:NAD(P)-dependent dehydrogenase (short-subunit alcohol dehydrogenase family)